MSRLNFQNALGHVTTMPIYAVVASWRDFGICLMARVLPKLHRYAILYYSNLTLLNSAKWAGPTSANLSRNAI